MEHTHKYMRPDALTPPQMAEKLVDFGVAKTQLPRAKQFVLSLLAGIFIGLGAAFCTLVLSDASLPFVAQRLLGGLAFCLGLYLVVIAGAELFTGNNLLSAAAAGKRIGWGAVMRNWAIVWVGNLVGSLAVVVLIYLSNYGALAPDLAIADSFVRIAATKVSIDAVPLLFKAILCNFLVCLAVWLTFAGRTLIDKLFAIILPITAFVAMGFEHSVANMFFLPMGYLTKLAGTFSATLPPETLAQLDIGGIIYNLSVVTVGNIIGGAVLVGLVYWFIYHRQAQTN
jgi:formate/nitrite transporter